METFKVGDLITSSATHGTAIFEIAAMDDYGNIALRNTHNKLLLNRMVAVQTLAHAEPSTCRSPVPSDNIRDTGSSVNQD